MTPHIVQWWGPEPWGPALDPDDDDVQMVKVPTPVGELCLLCEEVIQPDDSGQMTVAISGTMEEPHARVVAQHRECMSLGVVGHSVGLCTCTDYEGMSLREAALEAMRRITALARRGNLNGHLLHDS